MSDTPKRSPGLSAEKKALLKKLKKQEGVTSTVSIAPLKPVARKEGELFPLSFAQQRLWILDRINPDAPIYNVPLALCLSGQINIDALKHALCEIVRRHEALRTAFVEVDGVPLQKIEYVDALPIPMTDLRNLSLNERRKEALHLVAQEAVRPFDLTEGLLLRTMLLQLDEDEYILTITMHHIASDAWSVEVLYREIMAHYKVFAEDMPALPELPVQYVDYAVWQRQWLQGEVLERQLSYWKKQLDGLSPLLQLPTDRPRPAIQTFRGATFSFRLSHSLTANLKALSQREGVTLFMTLLAAFQVWLYRHTEQDDIAVGTPIANRSQADLEHLIGFFINTLVLRTDLSGNPSFRDILTRVRDVTLDAFNYREVPFELVVEALQPERNLSYSPLFQVLFTLQNASTPSTQPSDFIARPLDGENTIAKFDLTLAIIEEELAGEPTLTCDFDYNCDLFDTVTIDRFAQRFVTLLEEIVRQPDQQIREMLLLPAAEREQVLITWNATHRDTPQDVCLHQLFEAQVERTPGALALVFEDEQLSYEELNWKANQVAHYLQQLQVGPEVCVALCMERSLEMVIALLGILKAGGAYVPLDPTYPQERLSFMIMDVRAPVLLTQKKLLPDLPDTPATVVCLDADWECVSHESTSNPLSCVSAQNMAYVIYTSGSMGQPKGVVVRHSSIVNLAIGLDHAVYAHAQNAQLRVSLNGSLTFDTSVKQIVQLLHGHTLYILPQEVRSDAIALLSYLQRNELHVLDCTPLQLHQLLEDGLLANAEYTLSHILVGGEAIDLALWQTLAHDRERHFYNLYGPTECTVDATTCYIQLNPERPSIGRPIANVEVYILDVYLQPAPIGVPGEIYLGGAGLSRGYLNQAGLTAERFVPDPFGGQPGARLYRTRDRARWLADGNLEYLGRLDYQVKIRGFRIEPGEIEHSLSRHPGVRECVVVTHQDLVRAGQSLVAYIVPTGKAELLIKEVRAFLQQVLPDYMLPTFFEILEALPRTTNGKVDRQALPVPHMIWTEANHRTQLPRNPQEEAIAEIWKQVLVREVPGIRENFFEIGGHSLLAMQVISRIRAVFQVELPLRRLFETPTIEGLAQAVALARNDERVLLEPPITRAPRDPSGKYTIPISFAQQRLWILDRLDPGKATYNMPLALHLAGSLDRDALERSLYEIVARHAVLRTTFPIVDDTPVQSIAPGTGLKALPFTDLSSLPIDECLQMVQHLITEEAHKPFDLVTGPLFRTQLIYVDDTNYVLLLNMHHIVSDGWSMNILKRELSALYRAFSAGEASSLPALSLQYGDYAIWQRQWLQGEVLERQLNYWKTQLAGAPDVLPLPTDRPRGAVQSFRGASYDFVISPALTTSLKKLGSHSGATLFIVLLAAFQTFLSRLCNQEDIVVGTPIANRTHTEIEGLIGFFVNTLVLRTDLSGSPSFLDVVQRVRRIVLDALTYQDLPFEQIVEVVQPERNLSRSPLFQVMFLLQNTPQEEIDFSPLAVSSLNIEQMTTKFDLTLTCTQRNQSLEGEFEYNTDLFEPDTIARMAEHFQVLLTEIVDAPTQPIGMLSLLSQAQYRQIVVDWNATHRDYSRERLVYELVEERAMQRPEAPALSARGVEMTYRELNMKANQLAHYLRTQGVGPGSYVGIYMQRHLEMIVAILGTLKAGAAYLPLDATTPAARAAFILEETQVAMLITQKDLAAQFTAFQAPMLYLDRDMTELKTQPVENLPRRITPEYPAYVIYTSGSTGNPKGVIVEHKALLNMVGWYQEAYELTVQDKTTHLANLSFDAAVFELWPYLAKGAMIYLVDDTMRLSPTALVPWLVKQGITVCFLPTSLAEMVTHRPWPAQTALRLLLTGGDQLQRAPAEHLPFTLVNQYGPTENTVVTTWAPIPPQQKEKHLPVIGRAIANTQVYVLNQAGEPQPVGVPGELYIGGQSLSQGYLRQPAQTAACYVPDAFSSQPGARLYKTGDIVRYLPDGNLEFLGRRDHQVKIRGFRIELGEIETSLVSHPTVREAIVVVSESLPGEKRLIAYIIPQEGAILAKEELQRFLKERLPDYMVPTVLSIVEMFPLTPHGKVDRQALAMRRPVNVSAPDKYIAPRDAIELQLVHLWERLLGVSPIGVTDNFFSLGGHSLTGVRLMSQIQRLFGMDLPLSTLFAGATITSLANVLRQQEEQVAPVPLVEIQPVGSKPPLFCIHPSGGEVLCYVNLAHHLGSEQPVYGLQAARLHHGETTPSIEEMAAYYIEALYGVQPQGPYFLGGWSMGGVIAFEMARQLEARGQKVAFLGLFDSHLPPGTFDNDERALLTKFISDLAGMSDINFPYADGQMSIANTETQLEYLLLDAQRANVLPPGVDATYIKRQFSTFKKNIEALCDYQPQPYSGRITLFQANAFAKGEQVEITYGWHQFAEQVDASHTLPGDHYTILREPHVEILARQILSCMKECGVPQDDGFDVAGTGPAQVN